MMSLRLKRALAEASISQAEFAQRLRISRMALNRHLCGAKHSNPRTTTGRWLIPDEFRRALAVYTVRSETPEAERLRAWLADNDAEVDDLLTDDPDAGRMMPADYSNRIKRGNRPITLGDPDHVGGNETMLSLKAMKHFKMRRNPFANDINSGDDIFLSEDHIFLREIILDAAKGNGFVAVIGEVGSGKSVMRKSVYKGLADDGVRTIFPRILDKSRITASGLLEAVVMDLTTESVKRSNEARSRQAVDLLTTRCRAGQRQVLIVEEAHLLNTAALKYLKQIYEFEDGFRRLIGVVLIGQPELSAKLDEHEHPELREVTRRLTVAEIHGLSEKDTERYIQFKFQRCGYNAAAILAPDAYRALFRALVIDDGNKAVSAAYPLSINRACAVAMHAASELGEPMVTAELIHAA